MTQPVTPSANAEAILRWAFLVATIVITVAGFVLGETLTASLDGTSRTILPLMLFLVGTSSLLLVRFVLLPSAAGKPDGQRLNQASMAYGFGEAPATYGMVSAIMTGQGWIVLPFGLLALVGWLSARSYLSGLPTSKPEEFPRL